jgi:hypothetical protein
LVYDVSRWGRFQDIDASAYYEYHCRLNGVQIVYVQETFSDEVTPMATLLKGLKRAMAAEYSRELSIKCRAGQDRAIDLGFQMGSLPCIGLRRLAVSKEQGRTRLLDSLERKGTQSEHIRWVPGPEHEIDTVRRIFRLYAGTTVTMTGIADLLTREGAVDRTGGRFTEPKVRSILACEAFIGNFTWGKYNNPKGRRRTETEPEFRRASDVVESIVDRAIWDRVQAKRYWKKGEFRTRPQLLGALQAALKANPAMSLIELPSFGSGSKSTLTDAFGSTSEAFRLAGRKSDAAKVRWLEHYRRGWGLARRFVHDLFISEGIGWTRPKRQHIFVLSGGLRMRVQFSWRAQHRGAEHWLVAKHHFDCDYVLLARMREDETAQDFVLLSYPTYRNLSPWAWEYAPASEGIHLLHNCRELAYAVGRLSSGDH